MTRDKAIVVAIDGPAGAGKSTVTKRLARTLGYSLLDTGALYRSVALVALRRGVAWDDEPALGAIARDLDIGFRFEGEINRVFLGGQDVSDAIRTAEISSGASEVSALPGVREGLMDLQRRLGQGGGIIAEGRDVGTVVFPDAEAKFYLTASAEVRAQRRFDEICENGGAADYQEVLSEIQRRDERDSNRAIAPLTRAQDAILVDSSERTIEDVVSSMRERVASLVRDLG